MDAPFSLGITRRQAVRIAPRYRDHESLQIAVTALMLLSLAFAPTPTALQAFPSSTRMPDRRSKAGERGCLHDADQSRGARPPDGGQHPAAAAAELHEMHMDGSVMRMRAIGPLELPTGQAVRAQARAFHVMLLGLRSPLRAGQHVPADTGIRESGQTERRRHCRCFGGDSIDGSQPAVVRSLFPVSTALLSQ